MQVTGTCEVETVEIKRRSVITTHLWGRLVGKVALPRDGRLKGQHALRSDVVRVEVLDGAHHVAGDEAPWHTRTIQQGAQPNCAWHHAHVQQRLHGRPAHRTHLNIRVWPILPAPCGLAFTNHTNPTQTNLHGRQWHPCRLSCS